MSGEFSALEKEANQLGNQLVKETASLDHKVEGLETEKSQKIQLGQAIAEAEESIKAKTVDLKEAEEVATAKEDEAQVLTKRVQDLQLQFQAVSAGVAVAEGDAESTSIADSIASMPPH